MRFLLYILVLITIGNSFGQIVLSGSTENDIIGRIIKLPDTRLFAVVERNPDWGSGDFYGCFSSDNGNSWGTLNPIITEVGNQSTLSLVITPDDSLRLFYASDESGQYKIYTISSIDGINWDNKSQIGLGWSASTGIYDPQVIVEEDSSLTMIYIKLGGGAYVSHFTNMLGWDQSMQIVQPGAYRAGLCKLNGTYIAAYHRNISGDYDVHVRSSSDLINWNTEIDLTSNGNSHDPFIAVTENDEIIVFYAKVEPANYNIRSRSSIDIVNWNGEIQYTNDNTNNTQPAFFTDQNNLYLCYTHAIDYNTDNDIYFERIPLQTDIKKNVEIDWFCYIKDGMLRIKIDESVDNIESLSIINISGRKIFEKTDIDSRELCIPLLKESDKVLIIKLITTGGNVMYKSIIN